MGAECTHAAVHVKEFSFSGPIVLNKKNIKKVFDKNAGGIFLLISRHPDCGTATGVY